MKKAILISALLLPIFLTGCGVLDLFRKNDTPALGTTKTIVIDSEILKLCEPLPLIENPEPSQEELDAQKFVWIDKFGQCANKQAKGVKVIKDLANIKDTE